MLGYTLFYVLLLSLGESVVFDCIIECEQRTNGLSSIDGLMLISEQCPTVYQESGSSLSVSCHSFSILRSDSLCGEGWRKSVRGIRPILFEINNMQLQPDIMKRIMNCWRFNSVVFFIVSLEDTIYSPETLATTEIYLNKSAMVEYLQVYLLEHKVNFGDFYVIFEKLANIEEIWEFFNVKYKIISQNIVKVNENEIVAQDEDFKLRPCSNICNLIENAQNTLSRKANLRDIQINVHAIIVPTSLSEHDIADENGTLVPVSGLSISILFDLMETLNFRVSISRGEAIKRWQNNSLRGNTSEAFLDGQLDLFISHHSLLPYRAAYLSFLQPTIITRLESFFIQPSASTVRNIYTGSFCYQMWICIAATVLMIFYSLKIVNFISSPFYFGSEEKDEFVSETSILLALALLVQQGWHVAPKSMPARVVFIVGSLFGLVCYVAYSAAIVSALSTPFVPIDSFSELLDSSLNIFLDNDSSTVALFLDGLRKRRNDSNIGQLSGIYESIENIYKGESCSFVGISFNIFRAIRTLELEDTWVCANLASVYVTNDLLPASMIVPKHSIWSQLFNYKIMRFKEVGLIFRYVSHYNRGVYFYCSTSRKSLTHRETDLKDAFTAFFVILAGFSISVTILIVEFILPPTLKFPRCKNQYGVYVT